MDQSQIINRIEGICNEFDIRVEAVGVNVARLELAKAFAECEATQPGAASVSLKGKLNEMAEGKI